MKAFRSRLYLLLLFLPMGLFPISHGTRHHKNAPEALFQPTLNNLNTTSFRFFTYPQHVLIPMRTISDIVNDIHFGYEEKLEQINQVAVKNKDKTIKGYCSIEKGICNKKNGQKYITLLSRAYAKAAAPLDYLPPRTSYEKMVDFICPDMREMGYIPRKGGGVLSAYTAYRDNLIYTDCVNFDYPDTDELTNFGQRLDLNCLNTVYDAIPSSYNIISLGICRGAHALLKRELLNEGENRPCALVLESPLFSATDLMSQIIKTYVIDLPFIKWISYNIYCAMNPGFDRKQDNLKHLLATRKISCDLPILFIHIKGDPIVSDEAIFGMVQSLAEYNDNIHLLVLDDPTKQAHHGALHTLEVFQSVVNSFYQYYNLPHDVALAKKGQEVFAITQYNAYNVSSPKDWELVPCFES